MNGETGFIAGLVAGLVLGFLAVMITSDIYCTNRPEVEQWTEITIPHQAAAISVPEVVVWRGVQYDCVLRESTGN